MKVLLAMMLVAYLFGVRAASPRHRLALVPILVIAVAAGASYYSLRFI